MLQNRITVHSCIRRTKQRHFKLSESQIKTFFCFSPGRKCSGMFGRGVCCSEMHVRSRPSLLDRLTVKFMETFSGHKVCRRLLRTHLHITKPVWKRFVTYMLKLFVFWGAGGLRMNQMKFCPADSRFWEFGFRDMSETASVSMTETFILSFCLTVVNCTKY